MELTGTNTLRNNVRDLANVRNPRERDRIGLLERTPGVYSKTKSDGGEQSDSNDILLQSCNCLHFNSWKILAK